MVLGSAVLRLTADATDLNRQMDRAFKTTEQKLGRLSRLVGTAFLALGASITAVAAISAKAAIDFESSFAGVRKTVDATEAQFASLSQALRDLAKEIPVNVNELNRIGEVAGQLGVEVENIKEFTRVMAELGVTTEFTSDQAAIVLARFSEITGHPIAAVERLGSTLVELGNNVAAFEPEIANMALRFAAAADQAGFTAAQTLGLSAALAQLGIESQIGGTAVQRVLLRMNAAVVSGGEQLEGFADIAGVSAQEFADAFENRPVEALLAFLGGVKGINDSGGDLLEVLEKVQLADLRNIRVLITAANAQESVVDAINLATDAYEKNTATTEEFNKRAETTAARLQVAKNRLNDVAITIGGALLPPLVTLASIVGKVVGVFGELLEANPRLTSVLVIAGTAVGGLLLALGGVLLVLPSLVAGWTLLTGAIARYTITATGATTATRLFGIASKIALGPVGIVAAAIGVVAGLGFAFRAIGNDMDDLRPKLGETEQSLLDMRNAGIELSTSLEQHLNKSIEETGKKAEEATEPIEDMAIALRDLKNLELADELKRVNDQIKVNENVLKASTSRGVRERIEGETAALKERRDVIGDITAENERENAEARIDRQVRKLTTALEGNKLALSDRVAIYKNILRQEEIIRVNAAKLGEIWTATASAGFRLVNIWAESGPGPRRIIGERVVAINQLGEATTDTGKATSDLRTELDGLKAAYAESVSREKELTAAVGDGNRAIIAKRHAVDDATEAQDAYNAAETLAAENPTKKNIQAAIDAHKELVPLLDDVTIATNRVTQAVEDEAEALADLEEQGNEDRADALARRQDRFTRIQEKYVEDAGELTEKHYKDERALLERQGIELSNIQQSHNKDQANIRRSRNRAISAAERDHQDNMADALESHQQRLLDIQTAADDKREDAETRRTQSIEDIDLNFAQAKADLEAQRRADEVTGDDQHAVKLADLIQDRDRDLEELGIEHGRRLDDIQLDQGRSEEEQGLDFTRAKENRQEEHEEKLSNIQLRASQQEADRRARFLADEATAISKHNTDLLKFQEAFRIAVGELNNERHTALETSAKTFAERIEEIDLEMLTTIQEQVEDAAPEIAKAYKELFDKIVGYAKSAAIEINNALSINPNVLSPPPAVDRPLPVWELPTPTAPSTSPTPTQAQSPPNFWPLPSPVDLASGGIVRARPGGTLVNVGEGGEDEVISPLPEGLDFTKMKISDMPGFRDFGLEGLANIAAMFQRPLAAPQTMPALAGAGAGAGGGGGDMHLTVNVEGSVLAEDLTEIIEDRLDTAFRRGWGNRN